MPQDFSRQNLRGRSFKGQDLTEANFSYADIRGTDFRGANLTGADFNHAIAGLQLKNKVAWLIFSFVLSILSALISAFGSFVVSILLNQSPNPSFVSTVCFIILLILFFLTIAKNLETSVKFVMVILALFWAIVVALALVAVKVKFVYLAFNIASPTAVVVTSTLILTAIVIGIEAVAFAVIFTIAGIWTATTVSVFAIVLAGLLAITLILATKILVTIPLALAISCLSAYVGWRVSMNYERFTLIRNLAISIAANGGTNFSSANLTNVDFCQAILNSTHFQNAILTRTSFFQVKVLEGILSENTYLQNFRLRQLLIQGEGQNKNFDRQNLRGVNLKGANLADASFIGVDLSEANLQDADLSRAKLVQTQLDSTDFTGATLTGVYIQDWGITTNTKFDGVRCEYVYMRLPTKENPDPHRKPDNRQEIFALGEFGDFIKPIFDTLDLYHSQGIDPRAIAIAFKELAENNPEAELEIVAIERRGEDKILLRAQTVTTANKSKLSRDYFINYNQLKALAEKDFKVLIAEKEYQINKLENMITTALERPSFYVQNYHNQGDTIMSEGSKKQSNFDLKGAQFAGGLVNADTVTANQIGGNITNYSTEQKQNLAEAAADIQQLLNQLGQTYPTNTPLEKQIAVTEALKQIDSNPTLKARVIGALKSGGTEALKELVDHPLVNILLATLEGWQDAE